MPILKGRAERFQSFLNSMRFKPERLLVKFTADPFDVACHIFSGACTPRMRKPCLSTMAIASHSPSLVLVRS